jgi:uncharacterized membrane protein
MQGIFARPGYRAWRAALGLTVAAVTWDLAGLIAPVPTWWSAVSYGAFAGVVTIGCIALLLQLFARRRGEPKPRGSVMQFVAIGLLLGAWLLRGHPEIPPDPPLLAAAVAAALIYALPLIRRGP